MVSRPPSPAIAAVAAPHGEGFHVPRVFEKCATGLAGPSLAKPESSNGDFLSPGERIKSEGERQHKLSFGVFRRSSTRNCLWPLLAHSHSLGLGWGARPSRLPFSASRRKPFPKLNGSTNGSGATSEPARETRALPPIVHPTMILKIRVQSVFHP